MGDPLVATVGSLQLHPNLVNVVPGRVTLTVDLRHTDDAQLRRAEQALAGRVQQLQREDGVPIDTRRLVRLIERQAWQRGCSVRRMTSGAGHDAQMMARQGPSAMIFVPGVGGIGHDPREHTTPEDLARGAAVLLDALLERAAEP